MATRIDYDKSIRSGQLKWKRDLEGKLSSICNISFWGLFILLLVGGPIYWSTNEIKNGTIRVSSSVVYLILVTFGLIGLYGLCNIYNLRRVHGSDPETNRKVITRLVKRDFEKINEDASGTKILTLRKPTGLFSFGQHVTILFDGTDILINILTTGRHDIPSIYHTWINDSKVKRLIDEFKQG